MNKIIIADSSCLISLDNINKLEILQSIFGEITITKVIAKEFGKPIPIWIKIQSPQSKENVHKLLSILDAGEAEAIVLAIENRNSILIIDEKKGRKIAVSHQINIIGTLRVILLAKQSMIIDKIEPVIKSLKQAGFRISKKIETELLKISNEEK